MILRNITKEQALEIVRLIYPFPIDDDTEFEFTYQPYDSTMYEDAQELIRVCFDAVVFADKKYKLMLIIPLCLDVVIYYLDPTGHTLKDGTKMGINKRLPTRNQWKIQRKFMHWGLEPVKD